MRLDSQSSGVGNQVEACWCHLPQLGTVADKDRDRGVHWWESEHTQLEGATCSLWSSVTYP